MLDEYKDLQPIVYKILKNAVSKEKYSHAYLFETNGFYDTFNLVFSFTKAIMCPSQQTNKENCHECHVCEVIESGNFPEIEIIEPDGLWIKKGQMQELQEVFSKKALVGNKKIYIIKEAEKLNKQAANSILKFLEEPEEGIIAILITDNIYQVLETIRSRCQIISLKEFNNKSVESTLSQIYLNLYNKKEETSEDLMVIEKAINFINHYEEKNINTILYTQKLWHDFIKTKEDIIIGFDTMILYYKDVLNYLSNRDIDIFKDYQKDIENIAKQNNLKKICLKLQVLTDLKEKIKYNINTNLLMDKLIIQMEGV